MNITLGYTYYNCPANLEYLVDWYTRHPIDIEFVIVDDGSTRYSIKKSDVPENWRVFRVNDDIGFNNEGARNLAVCAADTKWMILLDCDRVLDPGSYDFFESIEEQGLDESKIYCMPKKDAVSGLGQSPFHLACMLFCKKTFFRLHGYTEGRFINGLSSYGHSERDWIIRIIDDEKSLDFLSDISVINISEDIPNKEKGNDSRFHVENKVLRGKDCRRQPGRWLEDWGPEEQIYKLARETAHMRQGYKPLKDMMLTYAWHEVLE